MKLSSFFADNLLASGNAIESPDLGGMKERLGSAGFIYLDLSRNGIRSVTSEVLHEVCPSNVGFLSGGGGQLVMK
jgi:hypothetical protein